MKPAGGTEQRVGAGESSSAAVTEPSIVEVSAKSGSASMAHALSTVGEETASSQMGSGAAGKGGAATGNGTGTGSGSNTGSGSSLRAVLTAPARYSETPKPAYPDSARREGREGQVMLRVLIDERGETKTVEVSRSSGSDTLDQAAASAIKRWRFHPARSGDQPIESWVSVPIDFRLTDTKN
jgi:protein TonB